MDTQDTAMEKIKDFRSKFYSGCGKTIGDAYKYLHELFDENIPEEKSAFYKVATDDEKYLFNH